MKSNKILITLILVLGVALSACTQARYGSRMVRSHADMAKSPAKEKAAKPVSETIEPETEISSEELISVVAPKVEAVTEGSEVITNASVIKEDKKGLVNAIEVLSSEKNIFIPKPIKQQVSKVTNEINETNKAVESGSLIWWILILILILLIIELIRHLLPGYLKWILDIVILVILIWLILSILGLI